MKLHLFIFAVSCLMLFLRGTATAQGTPGPEFVQDIGTGEVTVSVDAKPFLRYRHSDVPFKPYVDALHTPSGINVTRDAPADHLHHHGLMFAIGVNEISFWEETSTAGRQVHRAFADTGSEGRASFTETLEWTPSGSDEPLLLEQRTLTVRHLNESGITVLTWRTVLEPAAETKPATLSGSHYYGLGMRFAAPMDNNSRFFNAAGAEGEVVRGDERLTPAKWCAAASTIDGKPVTVAIFDAPANPRHPALWFTMNQPFAYLSATMDLWRQPLVLQPGMKLDLQYGVAAWDGEIGAETIEQAYQEWAKQLTHE